MIFIAKNEEGVPSWKLVQLGQKTVTRRLKPLPINKEFAIQPGRGKFAVCRAVVTDCRLHQNWIAHQIPSITQPFDAIKVLDNEAHKEGFGNWDYLREWFDKKGIDINATYRIEFIIIN